MARRFRSVLVGDASDGRQLPAGSWLAPRMHIELEPGPAAAPGGGRRSHAGTVGPDEPVARAVERRRAQRREHRYGAQREMQDDWFFGLTPTSCAGRAPAWWSILAATSSPTITSSAGRTRSPSPSGTGRESRVRCSDGRETDVGLVKLSNPPANLPVAHLRELPEGRGEVQQVRRASPTTSARCRSIWFGRSPSTWSNSSIADRHRGRDGRPRCRRSRRRPRAACRRAPWPAPPR